MHALLGTLTALLLATGLVSAADRKDPPAQAQRTKECTAQASDRKLTGEAHKQFVADCLKTSSASRDEAIDARKHSSQAEKMKTCNQEATAKNLHKDDRRQFMSECLKGDKKS